MSTALTLQSQAELLALDLAENIEQIFSALPDLRSATAMRDALVEQAKAITVADGESYTQATEQVQSMKIVSDDFAEIMDPYVAKAFKLHKALTAYRNKLVTPITEETARLKREREVFAAEQERQRQESALRAQREAFEAEQARLMAEASLADATGDSVGAEAILEEAITLEVAPVVLPSLTPKIAGTSFRSVWEWELKDITKLKPEFLIANEKAIGANVRSMHQGAETLVGLGAIKVTERRIVIDK